MLTATAFFASLGLSPQPQSRTSRSQNLLLAEENILQLCSKDADEERDILHNRIQKWLDESPDFRQQGPFKDDSFPRCIRCNLFWPLQHRDQIREEDNMPSGSKLWLELISRRRDSEPSNFSLFD